MTQYGIRGREDKRIIWDVDYVITEHMADQRQFVHASV